MKEKKAAVGMFPSPGAGHLNSMVALAKQLCEQEPGLSITIFTMDHPFLCDPSLPEPASPSPSVTILTLPRPSPRPPLFDPTKALMTNRCAFIHSYYSPIVREALLPSSFSAILLDMFCTSFSEIAAPMGLPSYLYFISGAAFLGLVFLAQRLLDHEGIDISQMGPGSHLQAPTYLLPLPAPLLPNVLTDRHGGRAGVFLDVGRRARGMKGILVNTFQELEPHAMASLAADPDIPPVYAVGPLLGPGAGAGSSRSGVMEWLDRQPEASVVFLCFGSMGSFGEEQVREMGKGVEGSGYRFVLSLRAPPGEGEGGWVREYGEGEVEGVLGEGFVERTRGRGRVIGWADQRGVLGKKAVGGFVTHCGWNSIIESLWSGVGMGAWPMSSEQQVNGWQVVKEMGVGVEVRLDYRKQSPVLVTAAEIEGAIRGVMEGGGGGGVLRSKVQELMGKARDSVALGGASLSSLSSFLHTLA